jgi:hypothetical protein
MVESAADRAAFVADFGEPVSIGGQSRMAIVDMEYFDTGLGMAGQETFNPFVTLPIESLPPGTVEGTAIIARAANYTAQNIRPDGTGFVTIDLIQ